MEGKSKEEILNSELNGEEIEFLSYDFTNVFDAMEEYAKQEAMGFAKFLDDFKIKRDSFINAPRKATTDQLYDLYLTYKSKS